MMLTAQLSPQKKNELVFAWSSKREDGPFYCPGCLQPVVLKQGYIYIHHFAHKSGIECPYSEYHVNESQKHLYAKKEIYDALARHKEVRQLKLERYMGPVRPDISFIYRGIPIAIEMQISSISPDVIGRRTREYTRRRISLLWLAPFEESDLENEKIHSVHAWERYVHSLYQGTSYYWIAGEMLWPVHFEDTVREESAHIASMGYNIPTFGPKIAITELDPVVHCVKFVDEDPLRAIRFWCKPQVWMDQEKRYLSVTEARNNYPHRYPDPGLMIPSPGEKTFSGDPFSEDRYSDTEEGPLQAGICPLHRRRYEYQDALHNFYCDSIECWARLRLSRAGAALGYPELRGITDPRTYLPDLTAQPVYVPAPPGIPRQVPVYPVRPVHYTVLIREGKDAWCTFLQQRTYQDIYRALNAAQNQLAPET